MPSRIRFGRWALAPCLALSLSAQTVSVDNTAGVAPVGELFASDPTGLAVAQPAGSGMNVPPGSQLSAGVAAATLKLARGGQVRICPRSSLNINRGGQGLMLGLGSGSIEIEYRLNQSVADVLVTPDFNIRLAGPAVYHFALGVNNKGDTCFKPLRGNTSGVVFSELLGEDSYGVMADERALFAAGKLAGRSALDSECGCPMLPTPRADAAEPGTSPARPPSVPSPDVTAPLPPGRPGETHVEVETPFVFSARDPAKPNAAAKLNVSLLPNVFFVQEEDEPAILIEKPAEVSVKSRTPETAPNTGANSSGNHREEPKKENKGFLARVKGFFGSIFRR